ncbi:MAG: phosphate acyltransferase PlsX, partial [Chloroflexota bacterium]
MKIAVDAMGTDNHPVADVGGAVLAAQAYGETMILVGDRTRIEQELQKHETTGLPIEIVHADDSITMEDKPNEVLRGKAGSSMHVAIDLVKAGKADAFVTCGNTGAALAVSMFQLKRIAGVRRPAITAVGELGGHLITVVDVGANTDTRLEWLQQFALMGHLYSERVLGVANPRVGLLANGTEETKGDALVREAHPVFADMPFNFVGNMEPKDLFTGNVDVLVMDGYVGNVVLKTYEGTMSALGAILRRELQSDWRAKLGAL